jgi:hypothetical protein
MNRDDLKKALDSVPALDELRDSKETEALQDLLRHPGLPLLWGLMLGARQTQFQMLAHAPLTNMETVSRASVIQGAIKGIEMFYTAVLEQAVPSPEATEQETR